MTCELLIEADDTAGSVLKVNGKLSVSGAFGGMAETTVREEVIKPVFCEDLVRLLEEWCQRDGDANTRDDGSRRGVENQA